MAERQPAAFPFLMPADLTLRWITMGSHICQWIEEAAAARWPLEVEDMWPTGWSLWEATARFICPARCFYLRGPEQAGHF